MVEVLTELADVILLDLAGMLDAVLDENGLENSNQRHGISPGRWLPLVTHIGDQLLTFLLEVRNGDDPLCPRLRCHTGFAGLCRARSKVEIGRLCFFRGRGRGQGWR